MIWSITKGLLCLIDGSKGLYAALTKALDGYVVIQRCQWHKRENVISYLPKGKQDQIKKALQNAYDLPTYREAKAALDALKPELALMNESAQNSLEEGLEETLSLHRLGLMPQLKQSFRTTNCIESLNSMVAQITRDGVQRVAFQTRSCEAMGKLESTHTLVSHRTIGH